MAARMSRRSATFSQEIASPSVSSTGRRSDLSPTRLSRIQEKAELQNLNDRLANYIDTVRNLEAENSRLSTLIRTTQETTTKEVTNVKHCYEKELAEVRKALDSTAKEKAKLQLDSDKYRTEADDLRIKLMKREKELAAAEKQAKTSDLLNQDLQRRVSQLVTDSRKLEGNLNDALVEISTLSKKLAAMKKDLDDEMLKRVDLQNRLQSAKEELAFKETMYKQEISETRHVKETEISELNSKLSESYEQKLADSLGELREHYETQLRMNRDDVETLYESKIADLQKKLDRNADFSNSYRDELRTLKTKVDSISSKNASLESTNVSLTNRIQDLEKMLEQEREWHQDALNAKEEELRCLRGEMEQQLAEYRELLDIKVALDMEIAAYRKLLEGEEIRLNISPSSSRATSPQPSRSSQPRSYKRRRLVDSEKTSTGVQTSARASGDIDISEHDLQGKHVKIHNKGKQEISVGGWQLVQKGEDSEVTYKFPRSTVIKPNATITVSSSNSGASSSPPSSLLMKNQTWLTSSSLSTVLLNSSGEQTASRESVKVSESCEIHHMEA